MSAKVHIVDFNEPADAATWLTARCGLEISFPKFVFMWDEQAMGEPLNLPLGCCRKCLKVEDPKLRYSYGVKV